MDNPPMQEDRGWPIVRYRFVFSVQTPVSLPEYAGSTLRGAFGHALLRTACMTRERQCEECPLYLTCPYAAIFQAPAPASHSLQKFSAVPHSYVIEPPPWGRRVYQAGEELFFDMTLFGQALERLALIVYAWQRAFMHGIGHGTAILDDVILLGPDFDESVFDAGTSRVRPHQQSLQLPAMTAGDCRLTFITPLRLQENGRMLQPEEINARILLMALARRVSLLAEFHAGFVPGYDFQMMNAAAASIEMSQNLRWQHWVRYSGRQKQKMTLNGLTGDIILRDVPAFFFELLQLGQWTHVGKNTTFGLGHYLLEREL